MGEWGLKRMENFGSYGDFQEQIMKEHWVSSVGTYIWPWWVKTLVEGPKDEWKEEE